MPGGDRTGPMGLGSKTGRGMGFCNGYNNPGFRSQARRLRGFRWRQIPESIEQERKSLEQQAEAIKRRLEELDKQQ